MSLLTSLLTVLLGFLCSGVMGGAYSDCSSTETAAPQEVGTTTIMGSLVYSMNHCTIVHNTQCSVSLSTGGPAPPSLTSVSSNSVPATSSPSAVSSPSTASPVSPSTEQSAAIPLTTTPVATSQTEVTSVTTASPQTPSQPTQKVSQTSVSVTSSATAAAKTDAAAALGRLPAVVVGAAGLVAACIV